MDISQILLVFEICLFVWLVNKRNVYFDVYSIEVIKNNSVWKYEYHKSISIFNQVKFRSHVYIMKLAQIEVNYMEY